MGNNDEVDMQRQDKLAEFLADNKQVYAGFKRMEDGIEEIDVQRAELKAQIGKQAIKTNGITAQTTANFDELTTQTMRLVRKSLVWATEKKNAEMTTLFNFSASSFKRQSKPKAILQAKAVVTALEANAPDLLAFNISAADIVAYKNLIAQCDSSVNDTSKASSNRNTATMAVRTLVKNINKGYDALQVFVVEDYSTTNPNFVNGFISNWKKEKRGVRHTGISATITDATTAKPVENATLTIGDTNKTAISNMVGLAEINKIKPGIYHISISAAGYTTQLLDVTVAKSKTLELDVALVLA